jgi:ubiquinone/menaquinone biosynthesis C-methylase UbiE
MLMESVNGSCPDEWLNVNRLLSLEDTREKMEVKSSPNDLRLAGKEKSMRSHFAAVLLVSVTLGLAFASFAQDDWEPPALSTYEDLKPQFEEAYEAEHYDRALELARQMNGALEWRHAETLYNIACLYALKGNKAKTYEWLERAIDAGYWSAQLIMQDEDLKDLKGEARFRELVKRAWLKGYIWILERDERDEFQKPDEVMKVLGFQPGERVADIGAGSGYFTIRIARAVGPTGKVWAIDLQQELLDYLARRLEVEDLENVEMMKVEPDDPELPEGEVDTILMVDTWHYIRDPEYARKMRAGLAPGGRLVIIDYRPKPFEERPWGPPPEQQTSREELDGHMAEAGFKVMAEYDFLPEQYFVVYEAD